MASKVFCDNVLKASKGNTHKTNNNDSFKVRMCDSFEYAVSKGLVKSNWL